MLESKNNMKYRHISANQQRFVGLRGQFLRTRAPNRC